jgi:hypothetical protein
VRDDVIARHLDLKGLHVVAKAGDAIERASLGIVAKFHIRLFLKDSAAAIVLSGLSRRP